MAGLFIMLEGTDGSGKTTQTELLIKRLQAEGHDVEQISFPQYGEASATMVETKLKNKKDKAEEVGQYRESDLYGVIRFVRGSKI